MVPGRDRTRDPWICSQTRICSQTHYRLRYAARSGNNEYKLTQQLSLTKQVLTIRGRTLVGRAVDNVDLEIMSIN